MLSPKLYKYSFVRSQHDERERWFAPIPISLSSSTSTTDPFLTSWRSRGWLVGSVIHLQYTSLSYSLLFNHELRDCRHFQCWRCSGANVPQIAIRRRLSGASLCGYVRLCCWIVRLCSSLSVQSGLCEADVVCVNCSILAALSRIRKNDVFTHMICPLSTFPLSRCNGRNVQV